MTWAITLKTVCLLFFLHSSQGAVRGLASDATTRCSSFCLWSDVNMWENGIVPTPADTVDLQATSSLTIRVDQNVSILDFEIGSDENDQGTHTLQINSGVTFTSSGQVNGLLSASITVQSNASLISAGQSTIKGYLAVNGFAQFGGASPSLHIYTKTVQNPLKFVNARLELSDGSTVVASNNVQISGQSSIIGSGNINATLQLQGTLKPGSDGIGALKIFGDLSLESSAEVYIDLSSTTSFDRVWISASFIQAGSLYANLIDDFEPLAHTEFLVFNHTKQRNGFKEVREEGITNLLDNKWQAVVDQEYTSLLYDDASAVFMSFVTILACLFFTLM